MASFLVLLFIITSLYQTNGQLQLTGTDEVHDRVGKFQMKCTFQRGPTFNYNITEIRIMKGDETLIAVKGKNKVKAVNNRLSYQATGVINNVAGRASLDVSFYSSSAEDTNSFICVAEALSKSGAHVILNTTELNVTVVNPSPTELFNFYSKLLLDLPQTLHKMNSQLQQLTQNVYSLNQIAKHKIKENEKEKKLTQAMVSKLDTLQKKLTPHTESGQVICGETEGGFPKKGPAGLQLSETTVTFKKPYLAAPVVVYNVRQVDAGSVKSVKYMVQTADITKEGFTLKCGVWGDGAVHKNIIAWTAFNNN